MDERAGDGPGVEMLTSDAATAIATRVGNAATSFQAAGSGMMATAAAQLNEYYDQISDGFKDILSDETGGSQNISPTQTATASDRIVGPMEPFDDDDLLYGPSAGGDWLKKGNMLIR